MSAIFGALSRLGAALDPELGTRMNEALSARPADAADHVLDAGCLLGARAFWVTPEAEHQSAVFLDSLQHLTVVADVRLDYRDDLQGALGRGVSLAARDEALIAAAYARWGEDCVAHLEGDFAFALWDARSRTLLLARDPYGVRALYYAELPDRLLFASQARALFADPQLERRADHLRVAEYLARAFNDTSRSFFQGVKRLPPGHVLVANGAGVSLRQYFAFDPARSLVLPNTAAYTEAFRSTFAAAVRTRARSTTQVGCMLSGGLDSSGVVGVLKQLAGGQSVPCFSALFPDFPQIDESQWLALHEASGGLALHTTRADRIGPLDDIDELHGALDEPFHAPNLFIYDALAKLAQTQGTRVLLDGLDGDSVVEHGWLFLSELFVRGRVRRLSRELGALHRRAGFPYAFLLSQWTLGPSVDRLRAAVGAALPRSMRAGYLDPGFAREAGYYEVSAEVARAALHQRLRFREQHARALTTPLMPLYLEVHDKLAAARGVDHRHPFFDRRLIELCLALPPEQRLHDGWDRVVQRRAFDGLVPDAICSRISKSVWSDNFRRQLFVRNGERIEALLGASRSPLEGVADLPALRRDLARIRDGRAAPERILDLWTAVTLAAWFERNNVTL